MDVCQTGQAKTIRVCMDNLWPTLPGSSSIACCHELPSAQALAAHKNTQHVMAHIQGCPSSGHRHQHILLGECMMVLGLMNLVFSICSMFRDLETLVCCECPCQMYNRAYFFTCDYISARRQRRWETKSFCLDISLLHGGMSAAPDMLNTHLGLDRLRPGWQGLRDNLQQGEEHHVHPNRRSAYAKPASVAPQPQICLC